MNDQTRRQASFHITYTSNIQRMLGKLPSTVCKTTELFKLLSALSATINRITANKKKNTTCLIAIDISVVTHDPTCTINHSLYTEIYYTIALKALISFNKLYVWHPLAYIIILNHKTTVYKCNAHLSTAQ